jgi:hypothetical protein
MLRQIRNYRFNPFTEATSYSVITDEVHAIPDSSPYWVRLDEFPDESYTNPTSGTPVYVRNVGGTPFSEVSGSPGLNEFRVDYDYKSGWIEFNSGNTDQIILVCYRGTGSPIEAELINLLQWFQPATPLFGGDGSDGDLTVSTNTALAEDPADSGVALKQYGTLTINSGITLSLDTGVYGMILAARRIKMASNAKIDVTGDGGAGGVAIAGNGPPGEDGGFGGGGGGGAGDTDTGGGGGGSGGLFSPGWGQGGAGGAIHETGGTGSKLIMAEQDIYWRTLANLMVYGAGGGAGGGQYGGDGGDGGGFIIINCGVLEIGSGAAFDASGGDGENATSYDGGGGGGAGGVICVIANRIVGGTAANIESARCDVSCGAGGTGGISSGDGGAGAAGYKRVIELYDYNKY